MKIIKNKQKNECKWSKVGANGTGNALWGSRTCRRARERVGAIKNGLKRAKMVGNGGKWVKNVYKDSKTVDSSWGACSNAW